jgi:Putative metallopeptidase
MSGAGPGFAQPAPSQPPTPPESVHQSESEKFQARIDAAVLALRNKPRYKNVPSEVLRRTVNFVAGNMLFVLLHELGHTSITELGLPVVGKMEDAADSFAAVRLIKIGSSFSNRVLTDAAEGWFLAARRNKKTGEKDEYYDEHGLNQQRAYQIVCYLVGSDDEKFKALVQLSGSYDSA